MSAEKFSIKLYTPEGLALEGQATSVKVPTEHGIIGILPKHVQYTGLLGTGILEFETPDRQVKQTVISGGFCSFSNNSLVILADAVDLPEKLDKDNYANQRQELKSKLEKLSSFDPEWKLAKEKLDRIKAIDRMIGH
ncbi:MAG: ATP synthase F1 subunit epsilon [Bdellovibrionales bacterium]|nr:ATP synthase F1 subunit epsilon [Bdellovibrionales bacterium]